MTPQTNIGRRLALVRSLLESESRAGRGLGVVAVAERLEREKTQISRGLASLASSGLVERDADSLEFTVGRVLLGIAAHAGEPRLVAAAWPVLRRLAEAVGERADLNVLHAGHVLTVESAASGRSVQAVGWTGRVTPVHCTASGRVLAAQLAPAALRELVGPDPLPVAAAAAPTTLADLRDRIARARAAGVAVADRELDDDVLAVAVPIAGPDGSTIAALSVAGPAFRLRAHVDETGRALRAAAAEVAGRV